MFRCQPYNTVCVKNYLVLTRNLSRNNEHVVSSARCPHRVLESDSPHRQWTDAFCTSRVLFERLICDTRPRTSIWTLERSSQTYAQILALRTQHPSLSTHNLARLAPRTSQRVPRRRDHFPLPAFSSCTQLRRRGLCEAGWVGHRRGSLSNFLLRRKSSFSRWRYHLFS